MDACRRMNLMTRPEPVDEMLHVEQPDRLPVRTLRALDEVDRMDPALRKCVHEFGYPIVMACVNCGVMQPNRIRNLVHEIWLGSRETWKQKQPGHKGFLSRLEWLMIQNDAGIGAKTLLSLIHRSGLVLVPVQPWAEMVEASMHALDDKGLVTKQEKHRLRLIAAVHAAIKLAWPFVE